MKINRALNLVIPIETDKGQIFVHSTPISREVFEQYFLVISKTFASIFSQGLGAIAGPRIAYLMLKKTSEEMGIWSGVGGVEYGLVNEIIRLSNVLMPTAKGWKSIPLHSAIEKGTLDSETVAEVEGELIFFTCVSMMNKRIQIEGIMDTVNGLWGSLTTSSNSTEFMNSLMTSTEAESSGEMEITSSLPS
jgi:hypothetical protein